jgi:hypothetical protein
MLERLRVITPALPHLRRNKINMSSVVTVTRAVTAGVVTFRETFGETTAYTVSEPSSAGVDCRLNNLGDVAGRAGDSPSAETRATIRNHGTLGPTNLGNPWLAANIVPLRVSTTREESLELQISLSRTPQSLSEIMDLTII